jgi:hypothetical protein
MGVFVDIQDVKRAHGIPMSNTVWDEELAGWLEEACDLVEDYANREFTRSDEAEARVFDLGPHAATRVVLIGDLSDEPSGVSLLNESGDTRHTFDVPNDLVMLPRVRRRSWEPYTMLQVRSGIALNDCDSIQVTGVWGFPQIPPRVKQATVETLREWLRGTQGFTSGAPDDVEPGVRVSSRALPGSAKRMLQRVRRRSIL